MLVKNLLMCSIEASKIFVHAQDENSLLIQLKLLHTSDENSR